MKKNICVLVLLLFVVKPTILVAENKVSPCLLQETNIQCVKRLVNFYSKKYHVSAGKMMRTLKNENREFDFTKQSELKYKKGNRWHQPAGSREQSFGIAQIHLPDHPNITIAEATDPKFSVEFMAQQFAKGNQKQWMGYPA